MLRHTLRVGGLLTAAILALAGCSAPNPSLAPTVAQGTLAMTTAQSSDTLLARDKGGGGGKWSGNKGGGGKWNGNKGGGGGQHWKHRGGGGGHSYSNYVGHGYHWYGRWGSRNWFWNDSVPYWWNSAVYVANRYIPLGGYYYPYFLVSGLCYPDYSSPYLFLNGAYIPAYNVQPTATAIGIDPNQADLVSTI